MKILSKAIIVLMIVFSLFYKSNIKASYNWVLKSGHLYTMTSNTTPTPFVATSQLNGAIFLYREPWQSFNATSIDDYQGSIGSGNSIGSQIVWADPVKVSKVYADVQVLGSGTTLQYIVELIKTDNSVIEIFRQNISSNNSYTGTINVSAQDQLEVIGIKHRFIFVSGSAVPLKFKQLQIIEWYEFEDTSTPVDPDPEDPTDPDPTDPTLVDYSEVLAKLDSIDQNIKNNGSLTLSLVTLVSLFGLTILNIRWFGGWKK